MGRLKVYAVGKRFGRMPRQYGGNISNMQEKMMDQMVKKGLRLGYDYGKRKLRRKMTSGVTRAGRVYRRGRNATQSLINNIKKLNNPQRGGRVTMPAYGSITTPAKANTASTSGASTTATTKRNHRNWSDVLWELVNSDVANNAVSNFGNRMGEEAINKAFGSKAKKTTGKKKRPKKKKRATTVQTGSGFLSGILAAVGL